ncbi:MAG: hypothetical protein ABIL62_03620, partial [Planctomycetota bacterium]
VHVVLNQVGKIVDIGSKITQKNGKGKGKKNIEFSTGEPSVSNLNVQCRSQSGAKYRTLPSRNDPLRV